MSVSHGLVSPSRVWRDVSPKTVSLGALRVVTERSPFGFNFVRTGRTAARLAMARVMLPHGTQPEIGHGERFNADRV